MLERVALRGMTVTEAAEALGIDRREALRLLHRGMLAAGGCLSRRAAGGRRRAGRAGSTFSAAISPPAACDDPARDRQPEPAAALERRR